MPLFWRLFLLNGLVLVAGAALLVLTPATVSTGVVVAEVSVLLAGLALMLLFTAVLVRASLRPLDRLTVFMRQVDLMHPGERLPVPGSGYVADVVGTFNGMLDRLEAERAASTAHALAAQEGERQRIARELHDEVGQSLTAVLLGLKRAVDRSPPELRDELEQVAETTRAALDEVRQVARRLRPGVLEDLGLVSALNALAADFTGTSGTPVERALAPGLPPLPPEVELVLYRIAQESLTNVARHADASRVRLALAPGDDAVELAVVDDGRGLDGAPDGTGIRGMRERALLVGGRLRVGPEAEGGTAVRVTVPLVDGRSRP